MATHDLSKITEGLAKLLETVEVLATSQGPNNAKALQAIVRLGKDLQKGLQEAVERAKENETTAQDVAGYVKSMVDAQALAFAKLKEASDELKEASLQKEEAMSQLGDWQLIERRTEQVERAEAKMDQREIDLQTREDLLRQGEVNLAATTAEARAQGEQQRQSGLALEERSLELRHRENKLSVDEAKCQAEQSRLSNLERLLGERLQALQDREGQVIEREKTLLQETRLGSDEFRKIHDQLGSIRDEIGSVTREVKITRHAVAPEEGAAIMTKLDGMDGQLAGQMQSAQENHASLVAQIDAIRAWETNHLHDMASRREKEHAEHQEQAKGVADELNALDQKVCDKLTALNQRIGEELGTLGPKIAGYIAQAEDRQSSLGASLAEKTGEKIGAMASDITSFMSESEERQSRALSSNAEDLGDKLRAHGLEVEQRQLGAMASHTETLKSLLETQVSYLKVMQTLGASSKVPEKLDTIIKNLTEVDARLVDDKGSILPRVLPAVEGMYSRQEHTCQELAWNFFSGERGSFVRKITDINKSLLTSAFQADEQGAVLGHVRSSLQEYVRGIMEASIVIDRDVPRRLEGMLCDAKSHVDEEIGNVTGLVRGVSSEITDLTKTLRESLPPPAHEGTEQLPSAEQLKKVAADVKNVADKVDMVLLAPGLKRPADTTENVSSPKRPCMGSCPLGTKEANQLAFSRFTDGVCLVLRSIKWQPERESEAVPYNIFQQLMTILRGHNCADGIVEFLGRPGLASKYPSGFCLAGVAYQGWEDDMVSAGNCLCKEILQHDAPPRCLNIRRLDEKAYGEVSLQWERRA
ncbi:hypothetical protein MCOR03_010028 [Pyricularia oryzae]|uniref:Uncharacterized protein n=1 Tax=Pyricularia grisea TaxID=148305 RepID=A0ABQ8N4A9_PYRGI|nr:hypothetical protein MCOR19_010827 [Pyricularia oryzae]KAI6291042.1 hypothetical protein MCOR33_010870 [Pyricularia grisea]KAI6467869.1 hypothetical protein MCOR18_009589 [Pyricularia oryzae]KAI6549499.1 hypothetical protein MCOR03_010028 [Pyricularia oryzae]KAI6556801.1 hypothetical protein MCOR09_009573 [Pyricularia oryzae]